jgi:hypothetical protein
MICDLFGKEIGISLYFICLLNYKHSLEDVNTKIMTLAAHLRKIIEKQIKIQGYHMYGLDTITSVLNRIVLEKVK